MKNGVIPPPRQGYGLYHSMSPCEEIIAAMFPEAKQDFLISTGMSSKLGNPSAYHLDFAWPDIKLDVEADGYSHCTEDQKRKDAARTEFLERRGWSVLRFSNTMIRNDPDGVRAAIESTISKLKDIQVTS